MSRPRTQPSHKERVEREARVGAMVLSFIGAFLMIFALNYLRCLMGGL